MYIKHSRVKVSITVFVNLMLCDKVLRNLISFWTEQGRWNFSSPGEHLDFHRPWIQSDATKAEKLSSRGMISNILQLLTENKIIVNLWLTYFKVMKYIYITLYPYMYMCQYYTYLSVIINCTWCTVCLVLLCNYFHVSVIQIFRFDTFEDHVMDA